MYYYADTRYPLAVKLGTITPDVMLTQALSQCIVLYRVNFRGKLEGASPPPLNFALGNIQEIVLH